MHFLRFQHSMPTSFYTLVLFAWLLALLRRTTCAIPLSPSLDENPKYEQAIGRSLPENVNNTLDVPSNTTIPPMLKKRMCNPGPSNQVICNIMVPGVDDANAQIEAKGVVGRLPSVFYTAYPLQLAAARQWASCFFQEEQPAQSADYTFGIWGRIANNAWVAEVSISLSDAMLEADFTDDQIKPFSDMFLKNLSQGYAEKAQGDVYLVVKDSVAPDNVSWDVNAAWGGWEFPALTLNPEVKNIFRVDPDTGEASRIMWKKGDPPTTQQPKGKRGETAPTRPVS